MRLAIQIVLILGLTLWCMVGWFAWILRDGMGPDAVESHGWQALTKFFWTFYWGPIFLALTLACLGLAMLGAFLRGPERHGSNDDEARRAVAEALDLPSPTDLHEGP